MAKDLKRQVTKPEPFWTVFSTWETSGLPVVPIFELQLCCECHERRVSPPRGGIGLPTSTSAEGRDRSRRSAIKCLPRVELIRP